MSNNNAAFLDLYWVNGTVTLTDDDRAKYINDLRIFGIQNQFLDLGKLNDIGKLKYDYSDAELNAFNENLLAQWIKVTRNTDPNQKIIGVLNYGLWKLNKRPSNFNVTTFVKNLDNTIENVLSKGLDGIHLDIEGFNANDEDFIYLISYLRSNSLRGIIHLSVSATHEPLLWSSGYIERLSSLVNELNPMIYDLYYGGANSSEAYINIVRKTLLHYSESIKKSGSNCKLVPYLPSYAVTSDHKVEFENMENGIKGVNIALKQGAHVDGVAIYWFPQFAGYYPTYYPKSLYQKDQVAFVRDWINK